MISLPEINDILSNYPAYRSKQVYDAIFKSLYDNWDQATNLPNNLKAELIEKAPLSIKNETFVSKDQKTVKALIYLEDGKCVETVLMKLHDRNSLCISTQVGCPIGCVFCDSGRAGFIRNLTISEIITQVIFFARYLKKTSEMITNIVFMGMGEPLLNYDNVISSIRLLADKETLGLSFRRFSISTSGILPGIKKLAEEKDFPINLAISLHSAVNEKRSQLMPINKTYRLDELSESIQDYFAKTKRKLMFEYILLDKINVSKEDALALRDFLSKIKVAYTVNLIPINLTDCGYSAPSASDINIFKKYLDHYKIDYIQRYSFGKDIKAACGQLAKRTNTQE